MRGVSPGLVRIVSSDQRIQRAETCRAPCAGCETDQRAIRTGIAIRIQTGDRRDLEAIMAVCWSSLEDRPARLYVLPGLETIKFQITLLVGVGAERLRRKKNGRRNLNRLKGAQTRDVAGHRPASAQEVSMARLFKLVAVSGCSGRRAYLPDPEHFLQERFGGSRPGCSR
jgi:hypothetical protein